MPRWGRKHPHSTVLSSKEEAIIVAFRKHTLLPLDDCLYALQATIPHLTRSSLHRCLKRHAISRLPEIAGDKVAKKPFKRYPIGYFHLDIAEVRTEEGKLYLFVAIDRTSKFVFAQLHEAANVKSAVGFLQALIEAVPYTIHIVLTDNGIQFGDMPSRRTGPTARYRLHMFDRICREHGIEHRLTKPNHPWTNGQVERMNRTLKEATVRRYHYENPPAALESTSKPSSTPTTSLSASRPWGLYSLRAHLQSLGRPAEAIQIRSNPPHFGTEHLGL